MAAVSGVPGRRAWPRDVGRAVLVHSLAGRGVRAKKQTEQRLAVLSMRRLLSLPSALPRCHAFSTTLTRSSMTDTRGRHLGSLAETQERNAPEQIEGPEQLLAVLGRLGRQGMHTQLLREVGRAQQAGAMDLRHYNAAV